MEDKDRKYIYYNKHMKKFQVLIRAFKQSFHVGYYTSLEEAKRVRDEALTKLPPEAFDSKRETKFDRMLNQLEEAQKEEVEEPEAKPQAKPQSSVDDILGKD